MEDGRSFYKELEAIARMGTELKPVLVRQQLEELDQLE